jgi:hypothetical protein
VRTLILALGCIGSTACIMDGSNARLTRDRRE